MQNLAIRAENLSKSYRIGHLQSGRSGARYETLRDTLVETLQNALLRLAKRGKGQATNDLIWALKDVSFDVQHGDVVGIIGRNGAGKSTLLKLLSQITEPTSGRALIYGRVGSLLEVGTGFHPELSGRENIYLNGAILGMTRQEINRKFDEIVAFAEVEKFLDTPVKRYSSGMYVRLAFAVAAHLEPEILLVDEVLAVGDAAFQRKCLGKMGDVARQGRTVLFVSHNMRAVQQLCPRSIWVHDGQIVDDGSSDQVVRAYLSQTSTLDAEIDVEAILRNLPPDPALRITGVQIWQDNLPTTTLGNGSPIRLQVDYEVFQLTRDLRIFFDLVDVDETLLVRSFHDEDQDDISVVAPGCYRSTAEIPANLLAPGNLELRVLAGIYNVRQCIPSPGIRIPIQIEATGRINRAHTQEPFRAKLAPQIAWITQSRAPAGAASPQFEEMP